MQAKYSAPSTSASSLFERPRSGERVVVVHVQFEQSDQLSIDDELDEIISLAESAGAEVIGTLVARRSKPEARSFIGKGKLEELVQRVAAQEIDLALFNHDLSPAQERNIERELKCRVLDRSGLILDIFAQRARTHEGKLQVELAQLQHMSTRLVRGWTHLERQKGGIGLRGPGETQLETDRRLIGIRIKQLHQKLDKVRRQREHGRVSRRKHDIPTVALVGYTNAGKSTLFNHLTNANVLVADQLFATLDPTIRRLELEDAGVAVVADTVGFISNLPHELVAAFRATLEEAQDARLLLHVVDASDELRGERIAQVNQVLAEIGAQEVPQILVFNKIDQVESPSLIEAHTEHELARVWISAKTGEGIDDLRKTLNDILMEDRRAGWLRLLPSQGKLRADLYERANVIEETHADNGDALIRVSMPLRLLQQLRRHHQLPLELSQERSVSDSNSDHG